MEKWETFYEEGVAYRARALKALSRPEIFNAEIMHNIAAMAIEKFFMAYLLNRNAMPFSHTLADLARDVARFQEIDEKLLKDLYYMDSMQDICSMDYHQYKKMDDAEIPLFMNAAEQVYKFVSNSIGVDAN